MQREIKFRGQRVDNSEWVFGYFVKAWDNSCYIITEFGPDVTCCSDCGSNVMTVYEVIPETVGQYTGLHDKNGKEIYEGDILKAYPNNSEYIGKVYYEDAQWFGACDYLNYAVAYSGAEVIGNIYENPELIS